MELPKSSTSVYDVKFNYKTSPVETVNKLITLINRR